MESDPDDVWPAAAIDPRDLVEGLGRGLRVIESFDDEHPRQTPTEVGERSGISRTAARRHLLSLVHFGYAMTDGRRFWLTPRVLRLGQSYLGAARMPRLVQPFIQRISMQCGQTVNASVLDGHEVVYVARSNAPRWVSVGYQVGVRVPAHVVTPGPVILSTWNDAALAEWVAAHEFATFTARTVTDPASFVEEVQHARRQGYWFTTGQLDAVYQGLSLPLIDRKGRCHGAIGMTVIASQYSEDTMLTRLLPPLREAAQSMRAVL